MPFTEVKAIIPKPMNIARLRQEILDELREEARDQAKELKKVVSGWTGDKPTFEGQVGMVGGNAVVVVRPTGNSKGVNKFKWLDKGTRIRWAVIINGRAVITGRRAMQRRNIRPRPGIKARDWTAKLQRSRIPKFSRRMGIANRRGVEQLYG